MTRRSIESILERHGVSGYDLTHELVEHFRVCVEGVSELPMLLSIIERADTINFCREADGSLTVDYNGAVSIHGHITVGQSLRELVAALGQ